MKKTLLSLIFLGLTWYVNAQVGVGTNDPKATLDVRKSTNTPTTSVDGVIPPNMTKTELANKAAGTYAALQTGALVYVSDVTGGASGASLSQVVQITSSGYYTFNGTVWIKLLNATDADTTNDAWVNNSTNTRVELGTTSNGVTRVAGTEVVATDAGRLGIGTITPSSNLEVKGSVEGNFREITAATNTILADDYHLSFSGTAASTLTLPTQTLIDGTVNDFRGRKYYIKNNSTATDLTIAATSGQNLRYGGTKTASNSYVLKPGNYAILTASGATGAGWDLDLVASVTKGNNWVLYDTALDGFLNQPTPFPIPTGTTYTTIKNPTTSADVFVTVTVPSGTISSRTVLSFTGWGDALVSSVTGLGSLSFIFSQSFNGGTASVTPTAMMSSWANTVASSNGVRYNFPVSYVLNDLAAGSYTFKLQVRREDETATFATGGIRIWGLQAKAEVYIKE